MALDRDSDQHDDTQADDTRDPSRTAMGGKGQRQATHVNANDDADDAPDPREAELERMRAALKKANREAADHRKRLDEIERAKQEEADKQLPEMEKLQRAIAKRDEELAETADNLTTIADAYDALRREFAIYKAAAGKVNPGRLEAVSKLLDHDLITEDEDSGDLRGVDKAIDVVLKEYPEFAAQPHRAGTPPVPSGGGTPPRRPVGGGGGGGNPTDRATEQLIQSGKYQRF